MTRILFILHTPPPVHGSSTIGQYIKESQNINKIFVCRYINLGTSKNIRDIGKRKIYKIFRYLSILNQTIIQLLIFKPQICYICPTAKGAGFYKDSLIVFIAKLFRTKIVFHFHNKGINIYKDHFFDNLLYRRVFNKTFSILLSKYLYSDIQKYVPESKVFYCPNGLAELETKIQTINLKRDIVEVLFISNLIESKGVLVLLKACKILQDKQFPFHCTFIGGEGDISKQKFHSMVMQLEVYNHVSYLGPKYGKEKDDVLMNADIFVHPTLNDCFPLVILEAMQNALPVIATREGGIPDMIENYKTGFLIEHGDSESLAEKLELLISNKILRHQMGTAGRTKFDKEFTLNIFENNLQTILNQVVNENN